MSRMAARGPGVVVSCCGRTICGMKIDGLEVQVVRKPIKNMYLRIKPPNGVVLISAPRRMAEQTIVDFVRDRRPWIDDHLRNMALARQRSIIGGLNGSGDGAPREPGAGNAGAEGGSGFGGCISGALPRTSMWTAELRSRAADNINAQLPALLVQWGPIIGRTPTHITLRVMTSRWGSCTPRTGRIRLNLQLGLMEPRFLEYVLVHEMTHLWESGHGAGFQRRMSMYLPEWKALRRDLNRRVVL